MSLKLKFTVGTQGTFDNYRADLSG